MTRNKQETRRCLKNRFLLLDKRWENCNWNLLF